MKISKHILAALISVVILLPMFLCDVEARQDSWEVLESKLLVEHSEFSWRKGNVLHLKLLDGSLIQLTDVPHDPKNNSADYAIHRLVGYIELHEYVVVRISHRTGLNGLLIDRKTGQRTELDSVAVFSPENMRFFTVDFTYYPNSKRRMQVWQITSSGPTLEWEFKPSFSAWSDVNARWTSSTSIYVPRWELKAYKDGEFYRVWRESSLQLLFGRWLISDLPRPPDPPSI